MLIDAWWFNNTQTIEDALYQFPEYPDVMPKTHIGLYTEGGTLELPINLEIIATSKDKILYEKHFIFTEANSKNDEYVIDIYLEKDNSIIDCKIVSETLPLLPENIKVVLKSGENVYSKEIKCEYATLSGRIVDFSGNPFPSPVALSRTGFENSFEIPYMWVWSRKDGTYSITVPKGNYHHFYIDDNTYRISTLENWGWHMIVDQDEVHDFKVGTGEVYSLCTWANNGGHATLFIYFRPMILHKSEKYQVDINANQFNVEDISPELKLEDMFVTINGHELTKLSLQKIYETGGNNYAMPAYILQVKRYPDEKKDYSIMGKQTLIVEYNTVDEKGFTAQSQGRTQFFYSNAYAHSLM